MNRMIALSIRLEMQEGGFPIVWQIAVRGMCFV